MNLPVDILRAELEAANQRLIQLADEVTSLRLVADIAREAVAYESQHRLYAGERMSRPLEKLADAVQLLYRPEKTP